VLNTPTFPAAGPRTTV